MLRIVLVIAKPFKSELLQERFTPGPPLIVTLGWAMNIPLISTPSKNLSISPSSPSTPLSY